MTVLTSYPSEFDAITTTRYAVDTERDEKVIPAEASKPPWSAPVTVVPETLIDPGFPIHAFMTGAGLPAVANAGAAIVIDDESVAVTDMAVMTGAAADVFRDMV